MFFPGSRYANLTPFTLTRPDGTTVQTTRVPLPGAALVLGYYRRANAQRLDAIGSYFLNDATAFWQLCDANDAVVPDALGARALVGIPLDAPVRS